MAVLAVNGCGGYTHPLQRFFDVGSGETPFSSPTGASVDAITHVLNRTSFGVRPGDHTRVSRLGTTDEEAADAYLDEQLRPESIDDAETETAVRRLETLRLPLGELFEYHDHILLRELVHGTILRAVYSRRQLYEVMVHFWTDHFNIDPSKGDCKWLKVWDDREVIRRYALGFSGTKQDSNLSGLISRFFPERATTSLQTWKFPEMVRASALSPAMLWYLDGRENRRRDGSENPNENYARELLELHTLGVHGGYTQRDVMEVARCLTGWTVRPSRGGILKFHAGHVEFQKRLHDDGAKEVLGHRIPPGLGAQDLDRVLDIVSLHPSTARYIATKLCRRFIADEPSTSAIESTSRAFLKSHGDIREVLRVLFRTDEFKISAGRKLKRPFHFVAASLRATGAKVAASPRYKNDGPLLSFLLRMGHAPFHYPTPDGYPEEANPWLGTLLWRWNFAQALSENRIGEAKIDFQSLHQLLGENERLMAHFLGRLPSPLEVECFENSESGLALCLGSPAFQRY